MNTVGFPVSAASAAPPHGPLRALGRQGRTLLVAAFGFAALTTTASAELRLCNTTASRVGVSIGYRDGQGWVTEGWWNIPPRGCETIVRGSLAARFYYIHAVDYDRGGEWSGKSFMCTRDREFTIRGVEDCLARGFDRSAFFEVDTGEQSNWTVQLTDNRTPEARP